MNELIKNFSADNSHKYLYYAIQDGTKIYIGGFTNKGRKVANPPGYYYPTFEYNSTGGGKKYKSLSEKAHSFNGTVDDFNETAQQGNYLHTDAVYDNSYTITPFNFFGINCYVDKTISEVNKEEVINVLITPNEGYAFKTLPYLKIKTAAERERRIDSVLEGKSARITYTVNDELNFLLIGFADEGETPTPPEPELSVEYKLTEGKETHSYENGTATINISISLFVDFIAKNVRATYKDKTGTTKTEKINVSGTLRDVTGYIIIKDIDTNTPVVIEGEIVYVIKPTLNLTNCRAVPPLEEYYERGESFTVTLVSDEGNAFNEPEKVYLQISQISGETKKYPLSINPDRKTATLTFSNGSADDRGIMIYGVATAEQIIEKNYGAVNVYVVTNENLDSFSKKRFTEQTGSEIDLGIYVNRIKRIFANVPTYGSSDIVCGNHNTGIQASKPAKESIILSFGSITIPAKNNDNTDYESNVQLFLPFVGFVTIDSELSGFVVDLEYELNVITGKGVARLKKDNVMLYVWDAEPSTDVLYRTSNTQLEIIGGDIWNEKYLYGLEPYLLIKWYASLNLNNRNTDLIRGEISGFKGFNSFNDITPITKGSMLTGEQETIYRLLEQGVIIE